MERGIFMKKFLKKINSKQLLVIGLCLLVGVSGYYRFKVQGNAVTVMGDSLETESIENIEVEAQEEIASDYFAKARYERDCARSEAAELLKVSTDTEETEETAVKNREMLEKYAKSMEQETAIENMVIAKGYSDCVAFVDDTGVRVVVKSDTLEKESVAQIKDIVVTQTGLKAPKIKVSTKE